jgi:hypothetical protein
VPTSSSSATVTPSARPPEAKAPPAAIASADTKPAAPASAGTRGEALAGDVLDFCALAPAKGGHTFVKQRVLLLAPGGVEAAVRDGQMREADAATLVHDGFLTRFPLRRFHNIVADSPAPTAWRDRGSLAFTDVDGAVEDSSGAAFARYSARCADYLVAPMLDRAELTRKLVKTKDKQGRERTVEQLSLAMGATVSLYRRTTTGFVLHARVSVSVPSAVDLVSDLGAASFAAVQTQASSTMGAFGSALGSSVTDLRKIAAHISAAPKSECVISAEPRDGTGKLGSCVQGGTAPRWLGDTPIDERLGSTCQAAANRPDDKGLAIACETRVRTAQLARGLQKAARGVEGWNLFDVLLRGSQADPDGLGIALGSSEGVEVGHTFQLRDRAGDRVGFLKVTDVGPGGNEGRKARTSLDLRAGDATVGSRIEEYPMLGISAWGLGAVGSLAQGTTSATNDGSTRFSLPKTVVGGGLLAGFDLSEHLGLVETHLRAGGSIALGTGVNTKLTMFTVDALMEKGVYLGPRLTGFLGLGGSVQLASVRLDETAVTRRTDMSATTFGGIGALGLDMFFLPELSLRLALVGRLPFTKTKYEEDEDSKNAATSTPAGQGSTTTASTSLPSFANEWAQRSDRLISVQGTMGLVVAF